MKTLGVAEKGSLLPWLSSVMAHLPPSLGGVWSDGVHCLGQERGCCCCLGVNYDQPRLPSTNAHWSQRKESEVSRILVPAFDMAFDKGFLDVRLLTGRLF